MDANAVAIALAIKDGKLWTKVQKGRLGDYFAIGDEQGLIEVALDEAELNARVADVRERAEIGVLEGLGSGRLRTFAKMTIETNHPSWRDG